MTERWTVDEEGQSNRTVVARAICRFASPCLSHSSIKSWPFNCGLSSIFEDFFYRFCCITCYRSERATMHTLHDVNRRTLLSINSVHSTLAVLVYGALHGTAARYLSNMLRRVADMPS